MKVYTRKTLAFPAALIGLALHIHTASAVNLTVLAPVSSLNLTATNAGAASLSLSNSGDQVWIISSSTNLVNWTQIASWKIHNGNYHGTFTNTAGNRGVYYRAFYDPAQQNISSTTTNALLLPGTLYN